MSVNWKTYFLSGLIGIVIIGAVFYIIEPREYEYCEVTDFLDVSAGTLFSSSICVYNTTCGKIIQEDCTKQLGDTILREVK